MIQAWDVVVMIRRQFAGLRRVNGHLRNGFTVVAHPPVALLAFALVGARRVVAGGEAAAVALTQRALIHICALVFPVDVLQVKSIMALADVASKCVDAFPEPGAHGYPRCTLIHIHTGSSIRSQLQPG